MCIERPRISFAPSLNEDYPKGTSRDDLPSKFLSSDISQTLYCFMEPSETIRDLEKLPRLMGATNLVVLPEPWVETNTNQRWIYVNELVDLIVNEHSADFIFFGHGSRGIVAHETALELLRRGKRIPRRVIISCTHLSQSTVLDSRADSSGVSVDIPYGVVNASGDNLCPWDRSAEWLRVTRGPSAIVSVDGGRDYIDFLTGANARSIARLALALSTAKENRRTDVDVDLYLGYYPREFVELDRSKERAVIREDEVSSILSRQAGYRVNYRSGGKVKPKSPNGFPFFNVSTTSDWFVLAVSENDSIGVDTEQMSRETFATGVLKVIASDGDQLHLVSSSPLTGLAALVAWTAKESVLKCKGVGLLQEPRTISLAISNGKGKVDDTTDGTSWNVLCLTVPTDGITTIASTFRAPLLMVHHIDIAIQN